MTLEESRLRLRETLERAESRTTNATANATAKATTEGRQSMSTIKALKDRTQAVRQHFEQAQSKLYRGDGESIYGEAEMKERIRALRAQRNQELDAIEVESEEKRQEADADLQALEDGSPVSWLTEEELEQAASRQALIAADVASLDDEGLRRRLAAVTHSAERPSQLGYYLAATRRKKRGDIGTSRLLEELREAITPKAHKKKVQEAQDSITQAGEIKNIVHLARREQSSFYVPNYAVPGR